MQVRAACNMAWTQLAGCCVAGAACRSWKAQNGASRGQDLQRVVFLRVSGEIPHGKLGNRACERSAGGGEGGVAGRSLKGREGLVTGTACGAGAKNSYACNRWR
jgi:hypothetical protein